MAKKGAKVTILDYSEKALKRSKNFFERNNLSAEFIKEDALELPNNLLSKYDISMSFGLSEHFKNNNRLLINKAHFDLLKKGGISFIAVPHKFNIPYRIYKFLAEITKNWKVGEEYPYSRKEFINICKKLNINIYSFFGDSLWWSFNYINPIVITKKLLKIKDPIDLNKIKKEKGTFLDQYLSYSLVLCGKK